LLTSLPGSSLSLLLLAMSCSGHDPEDARENPAALSDRIDDDAAGA
jgi:hypothetical protein